METPETLLTILLLGPVGLALVLHPLLSWFGLTPRGDPDAYTQRPYLIAALPGPLVAGSLLGWALRPFIGDGGYGLFVLLGLLGSAAGLVVLIVGPSWFRPGWQRRQVELLDARAEQAQHAREQGHRLGVQLVTADDDREPVTTAGDLATAREQAAAQLSQRPEASHALVVDLERDAAIRLVTPNPGISLR